ncbi:hypothetical protein [Geopseudomonas aromaticivorans]
MRRSETPPSADDISFDFSYSPPAPAPAPAPARAKTKVASGPRRAVPGKLLYVDPVPRSAWFANLRAELTPGEWDQVKKLTFRKAGYCCEICEGKGEKWPVECHERWRFDERTGVQSLVGLEALCPPCHESTHYGLAQVRGRAEQAFLHLREVNSWTPPQALAHINQAAHRYHLLSEMDWVLDARMLLDLPIKLSEETRARIEQLAAVIALDIDDSPISTGPLR